MLPHQLQLEACLRFCYLHYYLYIPIPVSILSLYLSLSPSPSLLSIYLSIYLSTSAYLRAYIYRLLDIYKNAQESPGLSRCPGLAEAVEEV